MLNWRKVLTSDFLPLIAENEYWTDLMRTIIFDDSSPTGLHLAVFVEPYLQYVLDGRKTVESRFSLRRTAPFGKVAVGDTILLKRTGGPILGVCQVAQVWFYRLDPKSLSNLRKEFTQALCAQDPDFWDKRKKASFATLIRLSSVLSIEPVAFPKQDRRGWVVLRNPIYATNAERAR